MEDKLYSQCQHAYTKGKSTQTAIFQFITQIVEAFEHNEIKLGLFLDLSKAYDCVNYEIFLNKMHKLGIRGKALMWFESYLSQIVQRVMW